MPQWILAPKDITLHPSMLSLKRWECVRLILVWIGRRPAIFKEDWALVSPRVVLARLTVPRSTCRAQIKCHYDNQLKANDSEVSA